MTEATRIFTRVDPAPAARARVQPQLRRGFVLSAAIGALGFGAPLKGARVS
nr:hypothetical protein KPHV_85030 [Kitasatospora purpeofusca]